MVTPHDNTTRRGASGSGATSVADPSPPSTSLERKALTPHRPRNPQQEFWLGRHLNRDTIVAKLTAAGERPLADEIRLCGEIRWIKQCTGCGEVTPIPYHCHDPLCPDCARARAFLRRQTVEWWFRHLPRAKHVVLTIKSLPLLHAEALQFLSASLTRLRRMKRYACWTAGCWSIEVTHTQEGWHPHIHMLVDGPYVDQSQLTEDWRKATKRLGTITYIRDCKGEQTIAEVCKYSAKGSHIAKWTAARMLEFRDALAGARCFGCWGALYKARAQLRADLQAVQDLRTRCECGCNTFRWHDYPTWIANHDLRPSLPNAPPHALPDPQLDLLADFRL